VWTFTLWLKAHLSLSGLTLAPRRRSSEAKIMLKLSDRAILPLRLPSSVGAEVANSLATRMGLA